MHGNASRCENPCSSPGSGIGARQPAYWRSAIILWERSTTARLAGLAALDKGTSDLEALSNAHAVFVDLILAQQIADIDAGRPPSNKVEVKRLSRQQRARLKEALHPNAHLDA